jgi:hypothetical protein
MKTVKDNSVQLVSFAGVFGALVCVLAMPLAYADSALATCGFSETESNPPAKTSPCTFSQQQGAIYISIDGGESFDFQPVGDLPGNFLDANGRAVYRRSGLGEQGQKFMLPGRFLFVYWAEELWDCDGAQLESAEGCRLTYGDIAFTLRATAGSSLNQLTVQATGLNEVNLQEQQEINGRAFGAEIADLDANGWPEVYVYVVSAGSGSYGWLVGYAVNNGKSATPVYFPELKDDVAASRGYMGHDEFAVVESRIVRRFPIYREGDTNAQPTGGMRQLQYKLVAGEAGLRLQVDRITDY